MNEKLSRREFLQTACIGIGALSLANGATKAAASSQMLNDSNTSGFPSCNILIIGSGGAGLRAAVAARNLNPNLSVIVATKTMPSRNATCMAEGDINGVLILAMRIHMNFKHMIL